MADGSEGKKMEVGEAGLHRQDPHQQKGGAIGSPYTAAACRRVHGSINDPPCQIGERQAEQTANEHGDQGRAEPDPVGAQILE